MATKRSNDLIVKRTALIDGDILAWRAASHAQSNQLDALEMHERLVADVEQWRDGAFCSDAIVCLSGSRDDNFRRDAYPLYKTNRPDERPEYHAACIQTLNDQFRTMKRKRLEADDLLGLLATVGKVQNPVMVSIDKDLLSVPGWHFNPDKQDFPTYATEAEADRCFHMQWLMGDSSDGYKGMLKVGAVKAAKILDAAEADGVDPVVCCLRAYREHAEGYDLDYCLAMARCARILRTCDWDPEKRRPSLWSPSQEALEAGWGDKE